MLTGLIHLSTFGNLIYTGFGFVSYLQTFLPVAR